MRMYLCAVSINQKTYPAANNAAHFDDGIRLHAVKSIGIYHSTSSKCPEQSRLLFSVLFELKSTDFHIKTA